MNECPYSDAKDDLLRRLKKVEGQVKGIQRMVENDKYCVDVLVQVAAARAAMNKVGTMIFEYHSRGCLKRAVEDEEDKDVAIDNLVSVLTKFIK